MVNLASARRDYQIVIFVQRFAKSSAHQGLPVNLGAMNNAKSTPGETDYLIFRKEMFAFNDEKSVCCIEQKPAKSFG